MSNIDVLAVIVTRSEVQRIYSITSQQNDVMHLSSIRTTGVSREKFYSVTWV